MAETRKKEEIVRTFKKWVVMRGDGMALAGALITAFGGLAGGLGIHVLAESVYGGSFPLATGLAVIMTGVLTPIAIGVVLIQTVSWCVATGMDLTEKVANATAGRFGNGGTGGPCNGSGGHTCCGSLKRGTEIGTASTSVIACASANSCHANGELVICCSRNKLAPANGGCACKKPCKICKCDRDRDANARGDESAKSDSQLTRGEREGRSMMDILGRMSDGRHVMESIDGLIAKLAEIAFPNANDSGLAYAFSDGGVCGNKVLGGGICGAKNSGGSCGRGGVCGNKVLGGGICG